MADILQQDIRYLKGVGQRRAALFSRLRVKTVGDLLHFFPRGYLNLRDIRTIAEAPAEEAVAVRATVRKKASPVRIGSNRTMVRLWAYDGTDDLEIVYFNNLYTPALLEIGREYVLYGKINTSLLRHEMINPMIVPPEDVQSLLPRYSQVDGLSSKVIASAVKSALSAAKDSLSETLPAFILSQYRLADRCTALHSIHFPIDDAAAKNAKRRLVFEQLLILQLGMLLLKEQGNRVSGISISGSAAKEFIASLPFPLTRAQQQCIREILGDFAKRHSMNRLLQGDVGSGKTVVAATAAYCAARSHYQSAIMVPTEILAIQHTQTLQNMFAPFGITVGLLTGSVKGKKRAELLKNIENGSMDVVVGTHALISESVLFSRLGFIVADEQHRFGVEQRSRLSQKGELPHRLVMSATPIPRTLALMIYGDLDVSILDEKPSSRQRIKTFVVTEDARARYLRFVMERVAHGEQAYIVCPLVEEGNAPNSALSATSYQEEIQTFLGEKFPVGLVHGRMSAKEKSAVMQAFRQRDIGVLVSTTVIEVGLDIPNATIMIIENADHFGLSTLHQLRGRIGRGRKESFCILVSSSSSKTAQQRLNVMRTTDDGFEIARQDLSARGPGDFLGHRQHGLPDLHIADLLFDETILQDSTHAAKTLLAQDTRLNSPQLAMLRAQVEHLFQQVGVALN